MFLLREGGEERIWGEDRPAGEWQIGNPPYSAAEVLRFCRYARAALRPVMGIFPRFSGSGKDRVDNMAVARAHQGEVCAHFDSGTLAFVPFGVWAGLETRGDHAHRRAQMEVIIVTWAAPPLSVAARAELEAMVATTGVKGAWPLLHTAHPWNLQPPRAITALPLEGARTAFVTAAEALRLAAADTSMDPVEADGDSPSADAGQAPPPPPPLPCMSALMLGPWRGLRWWKDGALGASPAGMHERLVPAWRRQMAWGNVPDAFVELCMACGMTDVGRKRICDRISRAIRAAAFQAVDLGRAQHAAQARQEAALADSVGLADEPELGSDGEAGDDDGGALSDSDDDMDRGSWSLAPRVGQHVAREAQGAAHKAVVAARKAAGAAARLAALEAERAAAALTAASLTAAEAAAAHAARPGRFGRAEAGKSGGRAIHFLSGDGRTTGTSWPVLAAWLERCEDTNGNEKHWARVDA